VNVRIAGIGTARPRHDAGQEEAAAFHASISRLGPRRARTLRALYRKSGVERRGSVLLEGSRGKVAERQSFYAPRDEKGDEGPPTARRMALYERWAPELAHGAAEEALGDARTSPASVSHLVTVSCTGFFAPGIDAELIRRLGLRPGVERTHVGFMGCHGALNGLRVARGFVGGDPESVVLVCAVELCSLHFVYGWDPDTLVANALFADGAGAAVCRGDRGDGEEATPGGGSTRATPWTVGATGSHLLGETGEDMTWRIGDHGFRMTLSARVPEVIRARLGEWVRHWLAEHGLAPAEVRSWAIHPGGPRILDAVEEAVGLDPGRAEVSREVLAQHGNMSSATVLFVLDRLRARGAPLPCVALAFGPGLVVEAALFVPPKPPSDLEPFPGV